MGVPDFEMTKRVERLSEAFNELSETFIKFSLAYNDLVETVRLVEDNQPTLFND